MTQLKNVFRTSCAFIMSASAMAFAQTSTAPQTAPVVGPEQVSGAVAGQPGAPAWLNLVLIAGIILFMWLFVFRPQSKRAKEQKDFLSSLTPGMEVITAGGLVGTVTEVRENIVSLNLGSSNVRVLKSAISGKLDAVPSHVQK